MIDCIENKLYLLCVFPSDSADKGIFFSFPLSVVLPPEWHLPGFHLYFSLALSSTVSSTPLSSLPIPNF